MKKKCESCGNDFEPKRKDNATCSNKCSLRIFREKNKFKLAEQRKEYLSKKKTLQLENK